MIVFGKIMVAALIVYMLYLIYYFSIPMCWFRFMLFLAIRSKLCLSIETGEGRITARYLKDGRELEYTKRIDEDVADRFLALSACYTLKSILADIKKGEV